MKMRATWGILVLNALCSVCDACSCYYFHPQEHYCTADFVALVTVNEQRDMDNYTKMQSYYVIVHRLFKANKDSVEGLSKGIIWTPANDAVCGITLKTNRKYLITGSSDRSKPKVSLCNYHQEWNALTRKQKKGFQRLYRNGCNCTVRVYHSGRDANRHCLWETSDSLDCQSKEAICVPSHVKPGCIWLGGQRYRECMKKRRRMKILEGPSGSAPLENSYSR
ncbi:tissue inhibitor of metalloproteinase-like [Ornithodoros turicata]|uniref:tissue inhibitor of metalloproteinase-like n=1 Tax=Ornithodoros turicata TaxID=34597 RepID=UPI0031397EF5